MLAGSWMLPREVSKKMLKKGQKKKHWVTVGGKITSNTPASGNSFVSNSRFTEGAMANAAVNHFFFQIISN